MPILYGRTPEWAIPKDEPGLLIESISFDGKPEEHVQKDARGKACGWLLVDETIDVSISGALPLGSIDEQGTLTSASAFRMGAQLALANVIPDIWSVTPTATTGVIKDSKVSLSNSDAVKRDISATVYAFGAEAPGSAA